MDSQQLRDVMKIDRIGNKYFRGVFASDELKKQTVTKFPSGYIANTDPSQKPGVHWVSFYFDENGKAEFFCSYGYPPKNFNFESWIEKNSTSWTYHGENFKEIGPAFADNIVYFFFCTV